MLFPTIVSRSAAKLRLCTVTGRSFSFSFTGPRKLEDIIKKDLVDDKDPNELASIWNEYHKDKEGVIGFRIGGKEGMNVLSRARAW